MRIFFAIILFMHGAIHLFGFLKAYHIAEFKQLTLPVSRIMGVFWLLAFISFFTAGILFLNKSNHWWMAAILAVLLSQVLIIIFWKDAKFGTYANILILTVALAAMGAWSFKNKFIKDDSKDLGTNSVLQEDAIQDFAGTLNYSGMLKKT